MACGIYMIQNLVNGKMYIGQSVNIEDRWRDHKERLRGNQNKPNKHLQNAWNKDGEDNFEFTIICECEENQLNTMEIEYISKLRTYDPDFGYNKTYGGSSGRPTEETKRKLSEAGKGRIVSEETRKKLREALKGRTFSEETRKKLSEAAKGRTSPTKGITLSEEHKKKLSEAHKGKTPSEETRKKLSEAAKGRTHTDETKQKISEANKGKTFSEEHKKNLSESLKGKYCGKNSPNYGKHLSEETKRKLSEGAKGRTLSEETKKKLSEANKGENNPNYGKHHSEEARRKISAAHKGKIISEEQKRKLSESHSIPVVQIEPHTNKIINVWGSSADTGREGWFTPQNVTACCKGRQKTHKGYKWCYLYSYIGQIDSRIKKIILFNKEYAF